MSEGRFPFTMARLEKVICPLGRGRIYFRDEKVSGLCLLVTARGAKSFYWYRKVNGQPERVHLGAFPEINVDTARDLCSKKNGKLAEGINPAEERRTQRNAMTLAELFGQYLETHAKPHKKRWAEDVAIFERYFGKAPEHQKPGDKPAPFSEWRNRRVNTINTEALRTLHVRIGADHGHYAANRVLALLSTMFNNAGMANPAKGIKKFHEQQRERFLDAEELARFRQALDDEPEKAMADFFRLCLFTMARRGNVTGMRWADVSFGKLEWTVPGEKTKNGEQLVVSLTDAAIEVLRRRWAERLQNAAFVFPGFGQTGHLVEPKSAWERILKRAKIENFRVHDLRHTGASWMAIGGASLLIIGKALGHKSTQSTARYAHVNRSAAATALQSATTAMVAMMQSDPKSAENAQQPEQPKTKAKRTA